MKKQFIIRIKLYAILFGLISLNSYGQVQIGQDIIGDFDHHGLGKALSLSADGNTVAIGCWSTNYFVNNGSVRVYGKNADTGEWEQIGDSIASETNDRVIYGEQFGRTLSLSDDGTVLAIGARGNNEAGTKAGHVRVFKKMLDTPSPGGFKWVQIGSDIDGTQAGSLSGFDVSLSGDGNVVAIGAPFFDANGLSDAGQVRVYKRDGDAFDNWVQIGSDIEGQSVGERFGASVSISGNGNTLAVAALNVVRIGHSTWKSKGLITRVYQNVNGSWDEVGNFMGDEGTVSRDERGGYVRLTGDGNALAITSWADGYVRVYKRGADDNNWTLEGNELRGPFGWGIALSGDAKTLVVGTPNTPRPNTDTTDHFGSGGVLVYKYGPDTTWQLVASFNGEHKGNSLGDRNSLSLSADGSVLAMGASWYGFNNDTGFNLLIGRARMYDISAINTSTIGVSIQGAPAAVNTTDPFEVTFTFDREVLGFSEEDIAVTNAKINNLTGSGLTYTATLAPTLLCDSITIDVLANVAIAQQVSVSTVDTVDPIITCLADVVVANTSDNGTGDCTTTAYLGYPVTNDNCSVAAVVALVNGTEIDPVTYAFGTGTTTVTWIVTDDTGNTASCEQTVTVYDDEDPTAICQDITVQLNADGYVVITANDINNNSDDNCGVGFLVIEKDTLDSSNIGANTVELIVTDASGNTAICSAIVTVEAYPAQIDDVFTVSGMNYKITSMTPHTVSAMGISGTSISGRSSATTFTGTITIPGTVMHGGATYTVTTIGANAFNDNPDLDLVTVEHNDPLTLHEGAFRNPGRDQIDLVVPIGKKQAYLENGWDGFRSITEEGRVLTTGSNHELTDFTIYPHPARDMVHITPRLGQELKQVNIYTMAGVYLYSENGLEINTSRLLKGMYLFEIVTKEGDRSVKKIVIADR